MFEKTMFSMIVLSVFLVACASSTTVPTVIMEKPTELVLDAPTEVMMNESTEAMVEKPTEDAMVGNETMEPPAWLSESLTNVHTGDGFSINDYKGKVVLVETLAMWCPTCKKQQMEVKTLLRSMEMNKDLVAIGLDIDPNENAADLKTYVENNGFDWTYAIAPAEVSREISNLYGSQFLNPPSAPMLLIDRNGVVHPLPFGIKSADELIKLIEAYL